MREASVLVVNYSFASSKLTFITIAILERARCMFEASLRDSAELTLKILAEHLVPVIGSR